MPEENTYQEELTQEEQVDKQRETAIKVLAGFGARVHLNDMNYAQKINELQNNICAVSADKVECMIVLMKYRTHVDDKDPMNDRFDLCGGTMGTEPEMTALLIALAADISKFRLKVAAQLVQEQTDVQPNREQASPDVQPSEGDDVQGAD